MEHGACERVKEQSHTAMPVKAEVDKAAPSTTSRGVQTNANFTEEEPGLVELVKSEPALLLKEEVVEDGWQDIAEQQWPSTSQGPSTSAVVVGTNVFDSVGDPGNTPNIKDELGSIDIGPTVLRHMDTQGTNNQKDISVVKQGHTINHDKTDPILCAGVKEEIIEDEWRGSPTPQDSLMEQSGTCTALHSLHKECLETVCRVQLIRLDTFQCDVCDAVYIDAHKLFQHVQDLHGPGPKRSLHVTSPEISIGPQQCATDMDRQPCRQATYKPAITTSMNVVAGGVFQGDMKEEWADTDMDVGPTVLQHMDIRYRSVQPDVSIIKQEGRSKDNNINPTKSSGVKEDTIEEEPRADNDPQRSNKAGQSKQRPRSQLYSCDECVKTYASKDGLMEHYRNRHSTESHKCHKCNKKFPSKAYLYKHISITHSEQQYDCAVCKRICKSKPALYMHVYKVHRPRPAVVHACEYCHKTYTTKSGLFYHIEVVHTKSLYRCSECNKEYKGKNLLQGHIRRVHSKEEHEASKPTCDYCKKMFTDKRNIRRHIARVHSSGSYKCHQCNTIYKCKAYLMTHKTYMHPADSKPRIYTCDYCKKMFTDKRTIRRHIARVHSSGSYKCYQCNTIFKCKAYLMSHKTNMHTAADTDAQCGNKAAQSKQRAQSQSYSCDKCVKTYASKKYLMKHYRNRHSTESHKCHKCNKKFSSKRYLYKHTIQVHSEQQYECAVCKKICKSKAALNMHVNQAHRARPAESHLRHTCTNCGQNFSSKWNCQRHEKSGKCARPTAGNTSAAASTSRQQPSVDIVKEEPADGELELGPVVFQHVDCNYRPYKQEPGLD